MREKSRRHEQLEILTYRYDLPSADLVELENLRRGYEGELAFDKILEDEFGDVGFIHIKDYCFKVGKVISDSTKSESSIDREIQIDNIVIAGDRIITFEVKNYNFDLKYDDGHWTYMNGRKFSDPLVQVRRQQKELMELVEDFGFDIKIFSTVVFINPHQTIYNLPEHPEIIVRSNMQKKLKKALLENRYDHSELRARLESRRLPESQYQGEVGVLFEELKAGVFCEDCGERFEKISLRYFRCNKCQVKKTTLTILKRLIYELTILNRSWKMTPTVICKYADYSISESCIRKHKKAKSIELNL